MAALEQELFASGLPVEALMEKAALAVVARLRQADWWELLLHRGALVLVGPGHNGGDGLVVARELQLAGIAVRLWCPFSRRKPLTEAHWRHARWLGIPALEAAPAAADPAVWIDALFGIGQRRPLEEPIAALLEQRRGCSHHAGSGAGPLLAIDVPSGLCADSGRALGGYAAAAQLTCCIGLIKQGLVQDTALAWVGELERIDLGLAPALLRSLPPTQPLLLRPGDRAQAPWPALPAAASKYGRGRLLVIAGSDAYRGAARLCLEGASASGCGSLRAAVPKAVAEALWQTLPHVVVSAGLPANSAGGLDLSALTLDSLERLDAIVLGPGLGPGLKPELVPELGPGLESPPTGVGPEGFDDQQIWTRLQSFAGLLLLDADGLNRLGQRTAAERWLRQRQGATWITPHAGEFARLFPDLVDQPPLEAASAAATRSGCTVLLKGARTVIAAPDGRRWQLRWAQPAAARAGLGDVLAGYAAGRGAMALAAGAQADPPLLAAAALEHAMAGETGGPAMAVAHALHPQTPNNQ